MVFESSNTGVNGNFAQTKGTAIQHGTRNVRNEKGIAKPLW
jgi:hypothetical protein